MSGGFSWEVFKFVKFKVKRPSVFDMVFEQCFFYLVFLRVVFKKALNNNEKSIFLISERDSINRL